MIQYDKNLYPKPYVEGKYGVFFTDHKVTFGVLLVNNVFWWSLCYHKNGKFTFLDSRKIFNDFDSAFNACRNWMKDNQNRIYGEG